MNLSRRRLFQGSCLFMGVPIIGMFPNNDDSIVSLMQSLFRDDYDLTHLNANHFHALKAHTFEVGEFVNDVAKSIGHLVLDDVSEHEANHQTEGFSLVFRTHASQVLEQGTYRFFHPNLGAMNLFMVPAGGDRTHNFYTVVFNRLL